MHVVMGHIHLLNLRFRRYPRYNDQTKKTDSKFGDPSEILICVN